MRKLCQILTIYRDPRCQKDKCNLSLIMSKKSSKAFERQTAETTPKDSLDRLALDIDEDMKRLLFNLASYAKRSCQTLLRSTYKDEVFGL